MGLTGTQIGILHGWAALVAVVVTPLIGVLVYHTQRHRFMVGVAAFTKGITAPLLLSSAWLWLTAVVSMRVISAGAHDALLNRLTLAYLKESGRQNIGSVRFWGSLSLASTSLLAGILARDRSVAVLFPLAGLLGIVAVPFVGAFPKRLADRALAHTRREPLPRRSPHLWLVLLIIFLFFLAQSGPETFAYVFLAEDLGAGSDLIGLLAATSALAPLLAYHAADRLLPQRGAAVTMVVSFGLFALSWGGYALIPQPGLALPLAAIQGFGQAFYTASMVILLGGLSLPERAATDQMLAQLTVPGVAGMMAQPVSGWIFDTLGARTLFALDALLLLLALGLLLSRRRALRM